jgi:hypothetical protein
VLKVPRVIQVLKDFKELMVHQDQQVLLVQQVQKDQLGLKVY